MCYLVFDNCIFVLCNRIINSGTNDNNNNKLPL